MPGPFDRFNDRAKRILALAQDEAIRFGHNYIGPEHLLLGIVREGEGVGARALDSLGVNLSHLRAHVERTLGRGPDTKPSEIVLAPEMKQVMTAATEEALRLGDNQTGTEHLTLGLVKVAPPRIVEALAAMNVTLEQLRERVIATRAGSPMSGEARALGRSEGVRLDALAILKTGVRVRLTTLIPNRVMSVRRDGAVTYDLDDEDEFRFIAVDARGRDLPGVQGRVRYSQIERIE